MTKEKRFGLDSLIQPTTTTVNTEKETEKKYVNSNIPLLEEHHQALRMIAIKKKKTMRELFTTIITKYLEDNGTIL